MYMFLLIFNRMLHSIGSRGKAFKSSWFYCFEWSRGFQELLANHQDVSVRGLAEDIETLERKFSAVNFPMDKREILIYNETRGITHKIYNGSLSALEGSILLQNFFQMHIGKQIIKVNSIHALPFSALACFSFSDCCSFRNYQPGCWRTCKSCDLGFCSKNGGMLLNNCFWTSTKLEEERIGWQCITFGRSLKLSQVLLDQGQTFIALSAWILWMILWP